MIDTRAVTTLFQPIVHLPTAAVVGFEALSRGPRGTALEHPQALIQAARQVGRLGELDWVCRTLALQAAVASDLHPSLSWFINVEPAGLALPCPPDLLPIQTEARLVLRVLLELTERGSDGQVTALLDAADNAREATWGVSLDDIGTDARSLGLLPLLRPDVVKLDMRALAERDRDEVLTITAAVRAYAERRGAVILAEGIEAEDQAQLARAHGATYGQGWLYGRPAPLPTAVPVPRTPIPLRQGFPAASDLTPFELVRAERTTTRIAKDYLLHVSRHLEQQGQQAIGSGVLLANFQRAQFFTPEQRTRYVAYADANAYTLVAAAGLPDELTPRLRVACLADDSPLVDQWVVIALGPHYAAALVAQDCHDGGDDPTWRRFDFGYVQERELVIRLARCFLSYVDGPVSTWPMSSAAPDLRTPTPAEPAAPAADRSRRWGRR